VTYPATLETLLVAIEALKNAHMSDLRFLSSGFKEFGINVTIMELDPYIV
jgi:hypothetical protein